MSQAQYSDLLDGLTTQQRQAVEATIATHSLDRPPTRDDVASWVAVAKGEQTAAEIAARWRR